MCWTHCIYVLIVLSLILLLLISVGYCQRCVAQNFSKILFLNFVVFIDYFCFIVDSQWSFENLKPLSLSQLPSKFVIMKMYLMSVVFDLKYIFKKCQLKKNIYLTVIISIFFFSILLSFKSKIKVYYVYTGINKQSQLRIQME